MVEPRRRDGPSCARPRRSARAAPAGGPARAVGLVAAVVLGVACSEAAPPPEAGGGGGERSGGAPTSSPAVAQPFESVSRVSLPGPRAEEGVELEGEARPAVAVSPGSSLPICIPEAAGGPEGAAGASADRLVAPVATTAGAARVQLRFGELQVTGEAGPRWRELALALPSGARGCGALEVDSVDPVDPEARVWLSDPLVIASGAPRPWVVVYVVDSLRFDRTPLAGDAVDPAAAPAFAAFARDGIVFERAASSSSWTRPSVASILTGLAPSAHGVLDRQDRLPPWVPRLQQTFADAGWHTVAVSTNPNVLPVFGFLDGFDRFLDVSSDSWLTERGYERLGRALQRVVLESSDRPLFLYVHDNEPHAPYRPLERYRAMLGAAPAGDPAEVPGPDAPPEILARAEVLQRATIRSTSDRFGALMDLLRELGRYDEAVVVLTADHGEEFGEHGGAGHGHTLYQEQLHVPLVIKPPVSAGPMPARIDVPSSLEGVAAATLELAGAGAETWPGAASPIAAAGGEGVDASGALLVAELDLAGTAAEAALRWPWKLVRTPGGDGALFDLSRDPGELDDLAASEQAARDALASALDARLAAARSGLEIVCTAGAETQHWALALELDGEPAHATQRIGLEPATDTLAESGPRLVWRFELRAPEQATGLARFDRVAVARQDADRDRLRVPQPPGDHVRIREVEGVPLPPLRGPGGEAIPTDGSPVALAALEVRAAPDIGEGVEPACVVFHVRSASTRPADVDEELEARLRALGYL